MTALVSLAYGVARTAHRTQIAPGLAERGMRGTFHVPATADLHEHIAK